MALGKLVVTIEELMSAAAELNEAANIYEEAVEAAKAAAADLASKWEGATREAFVEHQGRAYSWYKQILDIVRQMVEVIKQVAEAYRQLQEELGN